MFLFAFSVKFSKSSKRVPLSDTIKAELSAIKKIYPLKYLFVYHCHMETVPVIFHYNNETYIGFFNRIGGAGASSGDNWHLMIDNFYCGSLHYSQHAGHFLFHGNSFKDMGDYFEAYMTGWFA